LFLFLNIWFPLSLLSGAAITFVFFPIWLVRRYPLSRVRKVVAWFSVSGLLVCVAFLMQHAVIGADVSSRSIWVWPASFLLVALDSPNAATIPQALMIYGVTILSNVGLYGSMGLAVGSVAGVRKGLSRKNA
jgi:hypothetical protein